MRFRPLGSAQSSGSAFAPSLHRWEPLRDDRTPVHEGAGVGAIERALVLEDVSLYLLGTLSYSEPHPSFTCHADQRIALEKRSFNFPSGAGLSNGPLIHGVVPSRRRSPCGQSDLYPNGT